MLQEKLSHSFLPAAACCMECSFVIYVNTIELGAVLQKQLSNRSMSM